MPITERNIPSEFLTVDISTTMETVVEMQTEVDTEAHKKLSPPEGIEGLSKEAFIEYAEQYIDKNSARPISPDWASYWDCLMGIHPVLCKYSHYTISESAAEKLLAYRHLFQYGLNMEYLPAGFVLTSKNVIHYDPDYVTKNSLIAPQLIPFPVINPLFDYNNEDDLGRLIDRIKSEMGDNFPSAYENFTFPQKKAFIQIYAKNDIEALYQFDMLWNKIDSSIRDDIFSTLYKNMPSFMPFIENKRVQRAFRKLSGIKQNNPDQYQWFLVLLKQHATFVGYDDLPALLDAFQAFSRKIEALNLHFYSPIFFEDTKSLPTTLGRILSIIEHCRPEDRNAVWKTITKLQLGPDGSKIVQQSIRYFDVHSFVVPEMDRNNDVEIARNYFYEDTSREDIRLPLEYYLMIDQSIRSQSKFTYEDRTNLFTLARHCTTGRKSYELCKHPEQCLNHWRHFIHELITIDEISMVLKPFKWEIISESLKLLDSLKQKPHVEILLQLIRLMKGEIKSASVFKLKETFLKLESMFNQLNDLTEFCSSTLSKTSFYLSMICYTKEDYDNPIEGRSLFDVHLNIASALKKIEQNVTETDPLIRSVILDKIGYLIAIISHFNLKNATSQQIETIIGTFTEIISQPFDTHYAINVLNQLNQFSDMEVTAQKKLTADDLINFLKLIKINGNNRNINNIIADYVQKEFKDCFSSEFFNKNNNGLHCLLRNIPKNLHAKIWPLLPNSMDLNTHGDILLQCFTVLSNVLIDLDEKAALFLDTLRENLPKDWLNYPGALEDFYRFLEFFKDKAQKVLAELVFFFDKIKEHPNTKPSLSSIGQYFGEALPFLKITDPLYLTYKQLAIDLLMSSHELLVPITELLTQISDILTAYAGSEGQLVPFLRHYLLNDHTQLPLLHSRLLELNDLDTVRSLCCHCMKEKGKTPKFTPEELLQLFVDMQSQQSQQYRIFFLQLFARLLDSGKANSINELMTLVDHCGKNDNILHDVQAVYSMIPYPSLQQVNQWIEASKSLLKQQALFDKKPCKREPENGFHSEKAAQQVQKMQGVVINTPELKNLRLATACAQELSTQEIQQKLRDMRAGVAPLRPEVLLVLAAELLYRVNGQPPELNEKGDPILGRSFELNTTQYLALYAMLKSGKHVTSEMFTGEGKSRVMMIMCACQWLQGNTVDFITSDIQLATRDYLLYKNFFDALGAKTQLIYQNTPPEDYELDGINFSDEDNLSLARNKARSAGKGDYILQPDQKKRALMLDEADRVYYDLFDKRYNYAVANPSIRDIPWVYDCLIRYFSQDKDDIRQANYQTIESNAHIEPFIDFVYWQMGDQQGEQLERIADMLPGQLVTWQKSALVALSLKFEKQFVIQPSIDIQTPYGTKTVSKANLVIGENENAYAKFAHGVHECLHARLNWLKKDPDSIPGKTFKKALLACKNDFYLEDQKQMIYSTTSQCLLDDYEEGTLYAVTGTAGSVREIEEARQLYRNHNRTDSTNKMQFLSVPREHDSQREDLPLYLTADKKAQYALIVQQIKDAQKNQQPILLFCENDTESRKMMRHLQREFKKQNKDKPFLYQITAKTNLNDETHHIDNIAGQPGTVTVCTSKLGRGKDFRLHGEAKEKGFRVLINYLPRIREWLQMIGRAGRMGAKGDSRTILNKAAFKEKFKKGEKKTLTDGFYTAPEAYIQRQQAIMDRTAQVERLIKLTAFHYRYQFTQTYFEHFLKQAIQKNKSPDYIPKLHSIWADFFNATDKKWLSCWQNIQNNLDYTHPNSEQIQEQLTHYTQMVNQQWEILQNNLLEKQLADEKNIAPLKDYSPMTLTLPPTIKTLLATFDLNENIPLKSTIVYKTYDPAHDGRHVFYEKSFEKTRAWFRGERELFADFNAWWNGRGILFPGLQALFKGHISLKEYFTGKPTVCATVEATTTEPELATAVPIADTADILSALDASPISSLLISHDPLRKDGYESKEIPLHKKINKKISPSLSPSFLPNKNQIDPPETTPLEEDGSKPSLTILPAATI